MAITNPSFAYNLNGIADFSPERAFLNIVRTMRQWQGAGVGFQTLTAQAVIALGVLDSNGWPTSIPSNNGTTRLRGLFTGPAQGGGGFKTGVNYVCKWTGGGTAVTIGSAGGTITTVSSAVNRIVFNASSDVQYLLCDVTAAISGLVIVEQQYEKLYDAGEVFNPDWLSQFQDCRQLRFMDWQQTNFSVSVAYSDRAPAGAYTYAWLGVPVEVMVALANQIGVDPYFCMPTQSNDAFSTSFATYVKANLNAGLIAQVEYTNEIWNFGTSTGWISKFTYTQGTGYTDGYYVGIPLTGSATGVFAVVDVQVTGGKVVVCSINTDAVQNALYQVGDVLTGTIPGGSGFTLTTTLVMNSPYSWATSEAATIWGAGVSYDPTLDYQAYRATQVAKLWADVFSAGDRSRLNNVLGYQVVAGGFNLNHLMLTPLTWNTAGTPTPVLNPLAYLNTVSVAPYYYGNLFDTDTGDPTNYCNLLNLIQTQSTATANAYLKSLLLTASKGSIASLDANMADIKSVCASNGISNPVMYEGGQAVYQYISFAWGGAAQATNAATASGNVLHFALTPSFCVVGNIVSDNTNGGVIPANTTVLSFTSTAVTLSANVTGSGVASGDSIQFSSSTSQRTASLAFIDQFFNSSQEAADVETAAFNSVKNIPASGPYMQYFDVGPTWGIQFTLGQSSPRYTTAVSLNALTAAWFGSGGGNQYVAQLVTALTGTQTATVPIRGGYISSDGTGKTLAKMPSAYSGYTLTRNATTGVYTYTNANGATVLSGVNTVAFSS